MDLNGSFESVDNKVAGHYHSNNAPLPIAIHVVDQEQDKPLVTSIAYPSKVTLKK